MFFPCKYQALSCPDVLQMFHPKSASNFESRQVAKLTRGKRREDADDPRVKFLHSINPSVDPNGPRWFPSVWLFSIFGLQSKQRAELKSAFKAMKLQMKLRKKT